MPQRFDVLEIEKLEVGDRFYMNGDRNKVVCELMSKPNVGTCEYVKVPKYKLPYKVSRKKLVVYLRSVYE